MEIFRQADGADVRDLDTRDIPENGFESVSNACAGIADADTDQVLLRLTPGLFAMLCRATRLCVNFFRDFLFSILRLAIGSPLVDQHA